MGFATHLKQQGCMRLFEGSTVLVEQLQQQLGSLVEFPWLPNVCSKLAQSDCQMISWLVCRSLHCSDSRHTGFRGTPVAWLPPFF